MDPASMSSLVAELFAAIQFLSGYAPPAVPPEVHRVPQTVIQEQFCRRPCPVRAAYDATRGVFIDENLDVANNIFDRSILLHELVHHAQAVSGRFDMVSSDCMRRNRAEQEAYFIQNRYLMGMNSASRVSMRGWAARCDDAEVPTPTRH
ncbi:MAG TPA: DUF6647 family protein [Burkholderiales bacterium]|nr:DUF6647 family protein [Burkholderiales bacterium]